MGMHHIQALPHDGNHLKQPTVHSLSAMIFIFCRSNVSPNLRTSNHLLPLSAKQIASKMLKRANVHMVQCANSIFKFVISFFSFRYVMRIVYASKFTTFKRPILFFGKQAKPKHTLQNLALQNKKNILRILSQMAFHSSVCTCMPIINTQA